MKCQVYEFTATEECDGYDDREYTFEGYLLPTGEVLCPEEQTHDSFYENLGSVQAHGNAFVQSYRRTEKTVTFSDEEMANAILGSAREFGKQAIPESLRHWLE